MAFKIIVNKLVNFVSVPTAFNKVPKEASKTLPKVVSKPMSRLSHEEGVLSQEHRDEMMAVSVLLIGNIFCIFLLLQIKWQVWQL